MGALIKSLEKSNTIRTGITREELIWAAPMYYEMVDYKNKTDGLFKTAETQQLPADKKALLDKAKQFYNWHDYLDRFRLASAAVRSSAQLRGMAQDRVAGRSARRPRCGVP